MYYCFIQNGKINGTGQCKCLNEDIISLEITEEQYNLIQEKGNNYFIYQNDELVLNPDYEQEEATKREAEFKSNFFEIRPANEVFQGGWYRKKPKGYSSAVESMNSMFNVVSSIGILPANTLIFYTAPDFTKEEECTEEWLVQHQFKNEEMTATQFGQFYVAFMQAWNTEEHE